jgi:hypothetical protein
MVSLNKLQMLIFTLEVGVKSVLERVEEIKWDKQLRIY